MSNEQPRLGHFKLIHSEKKKGAKRGMATINCDDHALAYLLKGLNCRIDVYERLESEGPLAADDQESFRYTKELRDKLESARNETL